MGIQNLSFSFPDSHHFDEPSPKNINLFVVFGSAFLFKAQERVCFKERGGGIFNELQN